jgi:hypothetical protein
MRKGNYLGRRYKKELPGVGSVALAGLTAHTGGRDGVIFENGV